MKLPSKLIALLVILSLIGVFAYQVFWLTGLYQTMYKELDKNIIESLKKADLSEVFLRIKQLENDSINHGSIEANAGYINDTLAVSSKVTIDNENKNKTTKRDSSEFEILQTPEIMAHLIQKGLHQGVDELIPLNFAVFDSLLTEELKALSVVAPHYVEIVNVKNDSVVFMSYPDSVKLDSTKLKSYNYIFDMMDTYAYRLYLGDIRIGIVTEMMGILSTSVLIILLLGFSFAYLIRTILRQKTVEEIKSDFINNITHELKTPIAVAYAANDAMLNFEHSVDKKTQNQYLRITEEQLSHLSGLVEQILSMSMENRKKFHLHPEHFPLKAMFASLIEQHTLKANKDVTFTFSVTPETLSVYADHIHLYNVLSNLIENAVKYSGEKVHITLSAHNAGSFTIITVEDNGIGISMANQKRIFDKFFRVSTGNRHNVKGYGLGLFYVRTMIEKHNGSINIDSVPDKGSIFTIKIPLKQ